MKEWSSSKDIALNILWKPVNSKLKYGANMGCSFLFHFGLAVEDSETHCDIRLSF